MLKESKNNKNTAHRVFSVNTQGVITDPKSKTGFQCFILAIRHGEMKLDPNTHQTLIKML